MTLRMRLIKRYSKLSYDKLVTLARMKRIANISGERNSLIYTIVRYEIDKAQKAERAGRMGIRPENIVRCEIVDKHICTCTEGEYKDMHKSVTVRLTLDNGKKKIVRVCQNDEGLLIPVKIENMKLWNNNSSKRKSYITHGAIIPIQHHIAREFNIANAW